MDWITDTIAIGNYLDAEDTEARPANGIRSMICLNGKLRDVRPEALQLDALDNYDLKDGPGNNLDIFRRAVESVGYFARRHPKLLVQCRAGRSRSIVVIAAHHAGESVERAASALIRLLKARSCADRWNRIASPRPVSGGILKRRPHFPAFFAGHCNSCWHGPCS